MNTEKVNNEMRRFCERYHPLPMASIGVALEGIPSVLVDGYQGMREVLVHLIEVHGHRRIAFVRGPKGIPEADERYRAYIEVLADYGLPFDPDLVAPGAFDHTGEAAGEAAVDLLLDQRSVDFGAVAASGDLMARGVLKALKARGIRVPAEVAVTGFNNADYSKYVTPPLTTVPQLLYQSGRRAVEMVLAQIVGDQVPDRVVLPTKALVRQSCGCFDLEVMQAAAGPATAVPPGLATPEGHVTGETFETALAAQREQIVSEMKQAETDLQGAEQVWDAFAAELAGRSPGVFLVTLRETLQQVAAAEGDVAAWQTALSKLRRYTLPYLGDHKLFSQAESLWHQARLLIAETTQRVQAYGAWQTEQQSQRLREINQALTTVFDMEEMMDILARTLPGLGIERGYLCLYEDPKKPAERSRLILAYDKQGRLKLEATRQCFPSRQLLPDGLLPLDRRYSMELKPLHFQERQFGFVLFEAGPPQEVECETLRGQISSALQARLLMQQIKRHSIQLQTAAEISRVASSILDLTELAQQAVDLVRDRFNLYYVGLFLVDHTTRLGQQPGQYARLQAGTGEAGRQMKQQQKLEVGGQSMVGQCIATGQARIAQYASQEAVRFANPLLPETRSELALPLISRGKTIGALTIQSDREGAFTQDDIAIFQTMAGQLANSIENARLLDQAQHALKELEGVQRRYVQALFR